jgi:hypothetical protein
MIEDKLEALTSCTTSIGARETVSHSLLLEIQRCRVTFCIYEIEISSLMCYWGAVTLLQREDLGRHPETRQPHRCVSSICTPAIRLIQGYLCGNCQRFCVAYTRHGIEYTAYCMCRAPRRVQNTKGKCCSPVTMHRSLVETHPQIICASGRLPRQTALP